MTASSTGPSRESASAIHANGRSLIVPGEAGASSNACALSSSERSCDPRPSTRSDSISSASHCSGCPKMSGDLAPLNTSAPDGLALDGLAVSLFHRQRAGVEFRRDLQLVQRTLPLPEHAEQLKQKDAQFGFRRSGADLLLQLGQCGDRIPVLQTLFGDFGEAHGLTS